MSLLCTCMYRMAVYIDWNVTERIHQVHIQFLAVVSSPIPMLSCIPSCSQDWYGEEFPKRIKRPLRKVSDSQTWTKVHSTLYTGQNPRIITVKFPFNNQPARIGYSSQVQCHLMEISRPPGEVCREATRSSQHKFGPPILVTGVAVPRSVINWPAGIRTGSEDSELACYSSKNLRIWHVLVLRSCEGETIASHISHHVRL